MATARLSSALPAEAWALQRSQHGVVARRQLLAIGMSGEAIARRIRAGWLHPVARGVYAVGRPEVDRRAQWVVAALACGPRAVLSHLSAAALWGIRPERSGAMIDVTVPPGTRRERPGIRVHAQALQAPEHGVRHGIPVTSAARTLVDLASVIDRRALLAAVTEADKLDLVVPQQLSRHLEHHRGRRGVATLRELLERDSYVLTESELERRFLALARSIGMPLPRTGVRLNGFVVDFFWPDLRLVVETDGLRYHRTAAQQARDRRRDHAHAAAGLTTLRFTHAQVRYEPAAVRNTLAAVTVRLRRSSGEL